MAYSSTVLLSRRPILHGRRLRRTRANKSLQARVKGGSVTSFSAIWYKACLVDRTKDVFTLIAVNSGHLGSLKANPADACLSMKLGGGD